MYPSCFWRCLALNGDMAKQLVGEKRGGGMNTEHWDLLIQQEQPSTPKGSRGISSPGSSGEASLSLAATTAAPALGGKKSGYCSENGYLVELFRQERRRITNNAQFKPGELAIYAPWII